MVDAVRANALPYIGRCPMRLSETRGHKGRIYGVHVSVPSPAKHG